MLTKWISIAALLGLTAVAAGAFGAHALKTKLDSEGLTAYETAVRYQLLHALVLMAVAWVITTHPSRLAMASAWCILIGVILFSGSIYGLVLLKWRILGPVTPIGGALMMLGWLLLAIAAWPKNTLGP